MARIIGDNNDNQLVGTLAADRIFGLGGADLIQARGGNDKANGGDGDDIVSGGGGNDTLRGGEGDDILKGGGGNDRMIGDGGFDIMVGGDGNDRMIWNPGDGNDIMRGGAGRDVAISNGGDGNEIYTLKQAGARALLDRVDPAPFNLDIRKTEVIRLNGRGGDDDLTIEDLSNTDVARVVFNGGTGDDNLDASGTNVRVVANGGTGDDNLTGGNGNDILRGGEGNDVIDGAGGSDTMLGGGGDDRMIWNPFGGSDVMVGGTGDDTAVSNGGNISEAFTLAQSGNQAIFNRVEPFPFTLTITESETMEVNGNGGDDSLVVSDVSNTDLTLVVFNGGEGNDILDAAAAGIAVNASGGLGDDSLEGGVGSDTLEGGAGVDLLTGGLGSDRFRYGSSALGSTDNISDYAIAEDQYVLTGGELGFDSLTFAQGEANALQAGSNAIVLSGQTFANAGEAAQAIADGSTEATAGVFVYFNENLGIGRLVHSQDLGGGGEFNVLANMENVTQVADLGNFSSNNFALA